MNRCLQDGPIRICSRNTVLFHPGTIISYQETAGTACTSQRCRMGVNGDVCHHMMHRHIRASLLEQICKPSDFFLARVVWFCKVGSVVRYALSLRSVLPACNGRSLAGSTW